MAGVDAVWNIPLVEADPKLPPLPAGVDPHDSQATKANAVCVTLVVITAIVVAIRFFVLLRIQRKRPFLDDWLMLFCLVSFFCDRLDQRGSGPFDCTYRNRLLWWYTLWPWDAYLGPISWALSCAREVYVFQLFMIKVSVLMFYRRILGMSWMITANVILTVAYAVGSLIAILVAPVPIHYYWSQYMDPTGGYYRYNFYYFWLGNGIANVISDTLIFLVPIPVVWRQNLRLRQKLIVSCLLGLGVCVIVSSGVRLHYLTTLKKNPDITYVMGDIFIWSEVEPCLGIICACFPALQPFVRFLLKIEYRAYIGSKFSFASESLASVPRMRELKRTDSPAGGVGFDSRPDFYLGPMFIRVQHDVELTITEGDAF
ncbi:hypothetical protein N7468_008630 [Penicillium chermesinum]|uniref:Rhodopsin domain-containing protein n=1 Tax=Penicillium chermesinum TaxID=63820 RepID=A0A9W9TIM9_9EURO|nr:uncharacterized protein N7468_008630 [Penicillium chermesinum]KAJ5224088.1 hypothetical protein N7468_008630 [Penicillium chermesinum]